MSYTKLGGIGQYLETASNVLGATKTILEDPALPRVTTLVMELHSLQPKSKGASGPPSKGIGLNKIVGPLEFYVATQRNPILGYAVVAGILAVPFLVGYAVGKKR
jgi:hypothetical protein